MLSPDTPVTAYFVPQGFQSREYPEYASLTEDEKISLVPFTVNPAYIESAVHNLRTGLFGRIILDSYMVYRGTDEYVDVKTPAAALSYWYDAMYYDAEKRLVVGDNTYARAFEMLSEDFLARIADPMVLVWTREEYEAVSAMVGLTGKVTFATVRGDERPPMCEVDMGCRVEYVAEPDPAPFDLVIDPPADYVPPAKQLVIRTDSREFIAAKLAAAVCPPVKKK
jgi:hypothetical protein